MNIFKKKKNEDLIQYIIYKYNLIFRHSFVNQNNHYQQKN